MTNQEWEDHWRRVLANKSAGSLYRLICHLGTDRAIVNYFLDKENNVAQQYHISDEVVKYIVSIAKARYGGR